MWTSFGKLESSGIVKRVGINFGAPGDRKSEDGTLWLEFPSVGGASPYLDVHLTGKKIEYFRRHSSSIESGVLRWVESSGVKGIESLGITLGPKGSAERTYTVRLHFAEPEKIAVGDRVFDVTIQGVKALIDFDIVREAGGPFRGVVCEFNGHKVADELVLKFSAAPSAKKKPLLCGIELVIEKK